MQKISTGASRAAGLRLAPAALAAAAVVGSPAGAQPKSPAPARVAATGSLFQAVQAGDAAGVRRALDRGAEPNAEQSQITPLGLAVTRSRTEIARTLLARKASPNQPFFLGYVTPLNLAAQNSTPAMLDVLARAGAKLDAVSKGGETALLTAVRVGRNDNARKLLSLGASVAVRSNRGAVLLRACENGNGELAELLLTRGADPKAVNEYGQTALMLAARAGSFKAVRALVERGAPVNAADRNGATSLTFAARSGSAEIGYLLLARGADPSAREADGAGALEIASTRGHAGFVDVLQGRGRLGASEAESAIERAAALGNRDVLELLRRVDTVGDSGAEAPRGLGAAARRGMEKSLGLLQKSGGTFVAKAGQACASCHHQSLPLMAFDRAQSRGFSVPQTAASTQRDLLYKMVEKVGPVFKLAVTDAKARAGLDRNLPDPLFIPVYVLAGLEAAGRPSDELLRAVGSYVAHRQSKDGAWRSPVHGFRPPSEESDFAGTALGIRSLKKYGADPADVRRRIALARKWLAANAGPNTEDRAFRVLGLGWAGAKAEDSDLQSAVNELLAAQREDGGWAQASRFGSDAYSTGQALVALHEGAGLPVTSEVYQRGLRYLLRTQESDGSWYVLTRSTPFQTFFETDFPHGRSQFISIMGTSWAAMALTYGADPAPAGSTARR